ncbi:unnamed protein product [Symbiodinium sp. KB8]|nr:unnamed protein product [Symbiodinium sp. KB8]
MDDWIAITSADSSSRFSGVAAFLRRSKFQEDAISHCTWIPGRLLHIRCQGHRAVLDVVVAYQWVWQEKDADKALLLEQKLVLLNTWTSIDFVLTRRRHADLEAKTAHPTALDLVPWFVEFQRASKALRRASRQRRRNWLEHQVTLAEDAFTFQTTGLQLEFSEAEIRLHAACIRSTLHYGLHAVGLTDAVLRRLEAFDARMAGEEQMEVDQRAAVARNEVDLVFGRPLAAAEKEKEKEEDRPPKWPKQEGGGKGSQQSNWSGWGGNRQKRQLEPAQPTGNSCPDKATQELLQDAGAKWSELYSQGQVTMPLRVMLMMGLVQELKRALEEVRVEEDKYARCKEAGWARAKKQIVLEKDPLSNSEILRMLDTMESHVHREGVPQCFKSAKPYEELESAEVAPFVLTISLRTQAADELHDIFTRLSGNACCKLLGFRVRPERGARQPLAKLLEQKFQETEYCDWKKATSWRARSSA